jgi:signal peptidase II
MQKYAYLILICAIFIFDRWTKELIVERLPYLTSVSVTFFLNIVHARNYGGAFGFLSQNPIGKYVLLFLPIAITAGLIVYLLMGSMSASLRTSLCAVLAGAIGNLYDRISFGYVIDFIDVYYQGYHWPAFNVADSAITLGIAGWLYLHLYSSSPSRE